MRNIVPSAATREKLEVMETRKIESLNVSVVGLGCNNFGWRIDPEATAAVVDAALEAGVNFFDTADVYGKGQSEEFLGRALRGQRDEVLIATKFGLEMDKQLQGAKPNYVRQAAEESLRRLDTDRIDLYQLHKFDPKTPIADALGALGELIRTGKVREIGCSNFSAEQLREAARAAGDNVRFVSVQNEFSLFHRDPERDSLPECARTGLAFLPYFPLANGLLTGKYRKGIKPLEGSRAQEKWGPKVFTKKETHRSGGTDRVPQSRNHTILELAFAWLLAHEPVASVIAGASKPEQVRSNVAAIGWRLTGDELAEIDQVTSGI
jgi:aryl-alcohol dehydrogenase-like predicted oxidoreductase